MFPGEMHRGFAFYISRILISKEEKTILWYGTCVKISGYGYFRKQGSHWGFFHKDAKSQSHT